MLQIVLIALLLFGAAAYLGWLVYKSFTSSACESGCGKCGTLNVDAIMKSIKTKNVAS